MNIGKFFEHFEIKSTFVGEIAKLECDLNLNLLPPIYVTILPSAAAFKIKKNLYKKSKIKVLMDIVRINKYYK